MFSRRPFLLLDVSLGVGATVTGQAATKMLEAFTKSKTRENLESGRHMLEQGHWPPTQPMCIADACAVLQCASAFKPSVRSGDSSAVQAAVDTLVMCPETLTPAQYAAALSAVTAIHHPRQFDVLLRHANRLCDRDYLSHVHLQQLSSISSAYGRSGTKHQRLATALSDRATQCMSGAKVAQVANIAYAFAHMGVPRQHPVWTQVALATERVVDQCVPIAAATLLHAFATVHAGEPVPTEVASAVDLLERSCVGRVAELSPPILSSAMLSLAKLGRTDFSQTCTDRVVATIASFAPSHVADCMEASLIVNLENCNLFGALAERAAQDAKRYKDKHFIAVLETLSKFNLYDRQLTEIATQHFTNVLRSRNFIDINLLVRFLRILAATNTRNNTLISTTHRVAADSPEALSPVGADALRKAFLAYDVAPDAALSAALQTALRE
jgi:hypothetical protein